LQLGLQVYTTMLSLLVEMESWQLFAWVALKLQASQSLPHE
jgi:hypothetical protein